MAVQAHAALEADIQSLLSIARENKVGAMKFQANGLLSFNRFMHLFIIVTRHSKEQFIKEQHKVLAKRRQAFKLKNWKEYEKILQHEVDIERLKYREVLNYVLTSFEIPDGSYRASFVKYSMNRNKEQDMKDAR